MSTLPYRAEYAKSGKSACKGCKMLIENQSLRLAIMVQSSFFDGMQPNWYHFRCFFTRTRVKSVDDIAHFQNLRWADQEEIRTKLESNLSGVGLEKSEPTLKGKGKGKASKRGASVPNTDPSLPSDILDYTVEYAKSSRSKCKVCETMIPKGDIRISKKDYEGEVAKKYGAVDRWHHVNCFLRAREELSFFASAKVLPGFLALAPEDQTTLLEKVPQTQGAAAPSPPKKLKTDDSHLMDIMKKQNEELFKMRDQLIEIPKKDLIQLLEHNKQDVPEGVDRILDRLADLMTFGNLGRCPKCSTGQVVFRSGVGYQCLGYITDWTKCESVYDEPKRSNFKVPKNLKTAYPFLAGYKSSIQERAFKKAEIAVAPSTVSVVPHLPLSGLKFLLHKTTKDSAEICKTIQDLGGKISDSFSDDLTAIISVPKEVNRKRLLKVISSAKVSDVPVVTEEFIDTLSPTASRDDIIKLFKDKTCSSWGADISSKLPFDTVDGSKSVYPSKSAASTSKSIFKSQLGVQKMTLKDGLFLDPDSKLEKVAHVYRNKKNIYSVVLSLTDLQTQKNSFYKLQVLESDKKKKYWLFRSWGRIGTTIGGCKTEEYATLDEAVTVFEHLFEEKSGNIWSNRKNFVKVPGKMMMLEVEHGAELTSKKVEVDSNSKLHKSIQELVALIFDIEAMKKTMLEFELDLNKMPLGKLSQNQIKNAFSLLTDLQQLRQNGAERSQVIDRTNRFYTLVPHDFGIENPPVLDTDELINQKIDMLNSLLDIEIAYRLLEAAEDGEDSPIDAHYKKLNTNISVLDKDTDEFKAILTYVKNTHAQTHGNYGLVVDEVFKIDRQGESKRYQPYKKLGNRMLLWHGSRITNYAGILSQGLRIAPPEAPATGYMFGKGIYFADMVSKSANYCYTTSMSNTSLLLLCEVALGNMHELTSAKNLSRPPSGKNSVKGLGRTHPDPDVTGTTPKGAIIPYGTSKGTSLKSSLLYNEYIVYDVNQVNIQYLVKMTFKYGKN